ncbi:MAG: TonB-dependent receptor [Bacteroidota bacterium]
MNFKPLGLYLGLLMILPMFGVSQQTQIKILDKLNDEPVAFANVVISPLTNNTIIAGYVSDEKGLVFADIKQKSILRLSYIGFHDYVDTISPGEDLTIYLKSISYNVGEVVVTGQYSQSTQDKSIYKVSVLNSREIEQRAATNIKEMLSTELNIRVTHDGALGSSLKMQGLGGEHIKILIDGVPIIGRENGNIDLDQINLQNIDHIEVINGPMSVVYGSNALAGVINIITKSPDRLLFTSNIDLYYESVGVYNINGGVSASLKKNSFSFTGGRNFFAGFYPPGYSKYQQDDSITTNVGTVWKPKEQYNFTGNYKYTYDNGFIKIGAIWFNQELRDQGLLELPNHETRLDKYFYTRRLVLKTDIRYEFSSKSRINLTASFSKYRKIKNTYKKNLTTLNEYLTPGEQDTTFFDNILLRSDYSFGDEGNKIRFQTGIDLNQETGTGKRIKDNKQQIGDYAVYMSLNYSPLAVISIQPGLRFIYNTKFSAPLVYSFNVKYDATDRFIIRASVARGFRAPSLKELYLDFNDINHKIDGNENLLAETSINTSMLLQFNSTQGRAYTWGLELNLFNNNIKDNIKLVEFSGGTSTIPPWSYINVDRYITHGAELSFNNKIYPWLTVKFGLTLTGEKVEVSGIKSNNFEYYTDFNTSVNYWVKKIDINFSLYYKYNGMSPKLRVINDIVDYGYMDSYNTLDINMSRWFWKRRVNIQIGGKNLFDNTNIDTSGGQGGDTHSGSGSESVNWGRTFFIRLQFKFNK